MSNKIPTEGRKIEDIKEITRKVKSQTYKLEAKTSKENMMKVERLTRTKGSINKTKDIEREIRSKQRETKGVRKLLRQGGKK